jgi:hypothetical protein
MAVLEKRPLTSEMLDGQTAFELPDRETPLVFIAIGCGVCTGDIMIPVNLDVDAAANVCVNAQVVAALNALSNALTRVTGTDVELTCEAVNQPE